MRILLTDTTHFSYHTLDAETGIRSQEITFVDPSTIVMFSFEYGDTPETIDALLEYTRKYCRYQPILFPYAHLTVLLLGVHESRKLFRNLSSHPQNHYHLVPFGVEKIFTMTSASQNGPRFFRFFFPEAPISPELFEKIGDSSMYENLIKLEIEKGNFQKPLVPDNSIVWEPLSESGNAVSDFRSAFVKRAIEDLIIRNIRKLPFATLEIRGTNLFSIEHEEVRKHLQSFGIDNSYLVEGRKSTLVMRHAGCYQAFSSASRLALTSKALPLGIYEVADCYRKEGKAEVQLMFRHCRMSMVDLHVLFVEETEERTFDEIYARIKEFFVYFDLKMEVMVSFSTPAIRDQHIDFLRKKICSNFLCRVVEAAIPPYWDYNIEFYALDSRSKPIEIATIQLDPRNSSNYRISLKDLPQVPIFIFHVAIFGTSERAEYLLKQRKIIPKAVSPYQLLIILPRTFSKISESVLDDLVNLSVTIDNRDYNLKKKIAMSKNSYPYFLTVIYNESEENFTVLDSEEIVTSEQIRERLLDQSSPSTLRGFVHYLGSRN